MTEPVSDKDEADVNDADDITPEADQDRTVEGAALSLIHI